jgi:hypothetical protein
MSFAIAIAIALFEIIIDLTISVSAITAESAAAAEILVAAISTSCGVRIVTVVEIGIPCNEDKRLAPLPSRPLIVNRPLVVGRSKESSPSHR